MIKQCKKTASEIATLENIFDNNNKNYLEDKFVLNDPEFDVFYDEREGTILGYITVYKNKNFIEREHLPVDIDFKNSDSYIWNMCVDSKHEGKGAGTSLIDYVINNTSGNVYSIVNETNLPSIKIHQKNKMQEINRFQKSHIGKLETFILFKSNKKSC